MGKNIRRLALLVLPILYLRALSADIQPPERYVKQVERYARGSAEFSLVQDGKPAFDIFLADSKDVILRTAAEDLQRYFAERLQVAPKIVSSLRSGKRRPTLVMASTANIPSLAEPFRSIARQVSKLNSEAFFIRSVPGQNGNDLLSLGGTALGARYGTVEILRKAQMNGGVWKTTFAELRDEPYSTFRAIYINDSSHQVNGYSPNLIYPVETFRWPMEKWRRYIDQMAFFRYNVLMIWIVPNMFSPDVFRGGEPFDYFRDTMRAVGRYAKARGVDLCLLNGINVAVKAGTRLDTVPLYSKLPLYTYLSPLKPEDKKLNLALWDYWSKSIPEVAIWELFPGDPGGCHEQGCGPETYVDLALEVSAIIKKNNPRARIDFCPWQFYGWGTSWPTLVRKDTQRVDRGYEYLMTKLGEFPPDTMFSPNLNDHTSAPSVAGAGFGGGNTVKYIEEIARRGFQVHTWTYFLTEGEGWINHHYKVSGVLNQRDIEARYPISGGLCYTMTPELNILNQFACAEGFWDPAVKESDVMERYTEGIFGSTNPQLKAIFPYYDVAPMVGYTFASSPNWKPDYQLLGSQMQKAQQALESIKQVENPRFVILPSVRAYTGELLYYADLYQRLSRLALDVQRAREIVGDNRAGIQEVRGKLSSLPPAAREELSALLQRIENANVPAMKAAFQRKHYQLFVDYKTEFTPLLPNLINGFFSAFGGDFVAAAAR